MQLKRIVFLFLSAVFFLTAACSGTETKTPSPPAEDTAEPSVSEAPLASSLLQNPYVFTESGVLAGIVETAGASLHHMISVSNGAELTASDITLDKVDNGSESVSADALYSGSEAMIFLESADLTLSASAISGTFPYAHALCLTSGSNGTVNNTIVVTTGDSQSAVFLSNSSMKITDGLLVSSGKGAYTLWVDDSELICDMTDMSVNDFADAGVLNTRNSRTELEDCELAGNLQYSGENSIEFYGASLTGDIFAEDIDAELTVRLMNCSVLTGCTYDVSAAGFSIWLDKSSSWSLTDDAFVAGLDSADRTLSNIQSNGYSLYYNSEYEGNEWLESKTLQLPGGGYLIPML